MMIVLILCMTDVHAEQSSVNAFSEARADSDFCWLCSMQGPTRTTSRPTSKGGEPTRLLGWKLLSLSLAYYTTSKCYCQPMLT